MSGQRIFRDLLETGPNKGLPKCVVSSCNQPGQNTGNRRKDGSIHYRAQCSGHHAMRYSLEGSYRIYKKDYCENIDGRLGFKCTTTVIDQCMLDVDHINHVHEDNSQRNLQTLCSCCHNYKTRYFDTLTEETIRRKFKQNSQLLCD